MSNSIKEEENMRSKLKENIPVISSISSKLSGKNRDFLGPKVHENLY